LRDRGSWLRRDAGSIRSSARAVRIVREIGKSIAQVARDLGINDGMLANWVKKDRESRGEGLLVSWRRTSLAGSGRSRTPWWGGSA
jgi:hypothetical protein